jgi:hypothetical protein
MIWAQLAKVGLKHGRRVLAAAASEPPNSPLYSLPTVGRPVISLELVRSVVAHQFCDGHDDLEGCLSIFAVSYPSQDSVTAANEQNGLYDRQANGTTAPMWFQLRQVFGAYHHLLQILLGEDHNLPLGILNLFKVMDHLAPIYPTDWIKGAQQCAKLMTSIDIYTWSWVEQQQASAMPVSPEYGLLAQKLRLRKWSLPPLSCQRRIAEEQLQPRVLWLQSRPPQRHLLWLTQPANQVCMTATSPSPDCYG